MSHRVGCARFAQKALSRGVALEVSRIDDLQGNREAQVGIVSLVGDPHGPSPQLPEAAILPPEYLVLVIAFGRRHGSYDNKLKEAGDHNQSLTRAEADLSDACAAGKGALIQSGKGIPSPGDRAYSSTGLILTTSSSNLVRLNKIRRCGSISRRGQTTYGGRNGSGNGSW